MEYMTVVRVETYKKEGIRSYLLGYGTQITKKLAWILHHWNEGKEGTVEKCN